MKFPIEDLPAKRQADFSKVNKAGYVIYKQLKIMICRRMLYQIWRQEERRSVYKNIEVIEVMLTPQKLI